MYKRQVQERGIMGARRIRREQRRFDQNLSRRVNGMKKDDCLSRAASEIP